MLRAPLKALSVLCILSLAFAGCTAPPATDAESCVEDCGPEPDPRCPDGSPQQAGVPCPPPVNATPAPAPVLPWHPSDGAAEVTDILLEGVGGHQVPATVYRPLVAGPNATVPVLLHSHGWAGTRTSDAEAFLPFLATGFGVVSLDMRGHGDASEYSAAGVHRIDAEIADLVQVVDEVATWDWVHLDAPGDPRMGAMGGSYGGGYQLLLAAVDARIDAIAPEITWHDLLGSLAPQGAPKSAWIDLLYWGAMARQTSLAQDIHEANLWLQSTNRVPDGSLPGQVDIVTPFAASSPGSYEGRIRIPALFIQGAPDTLFPFNEAVANYQMVQATGAPVSLVTHLGGHILNTDGTIPDPGLGQDVGLQPPQGDSPCGAVEDMVLRWHARHLIGLDLPTGPRVCLVLEDGQTVVADDFPVPGTQWQTVEVGDAMIAVGPRGLPFEATLLEAEQDVRVVGVPKMRAEVEAPLDAIVYWTLEKVAVDGARHVVLSQVTPMRVEGGGSLELDLLGIAVELAKGESLVIVGSDRNPQFLHNESRSPGLVELAGVELDLPVLAVS